MSSYTELDTALLDLDFTNPRIQNYLQNYPKELWRSSVWIEKSFCLRQMTSSYR